MISRKFTIWACGLLFVFGSCAEDMVKPIENDKDAPGTVQDVKTESLPGAVKFTYTLPIRICCMCWPSILIKQGKSWSSVPRFTRTLLR